MNTDPRTIAVYDAHAEDYRTKFGSSEPSAHLIRFMDALPVGASVLDLGCGPGISSIHLRDAGHAPDPVDASPAMVDLTQSQGLPARLASFDDLDSVAAYDGVWANFSLLHAPRERLPRHLSAIATALRPNGIFHIGMKTGDGENRDHLDRLYTFVTIPELRDLLTDVGFEITYQDTGSEAGLAGTVDPWIVLQARKI